LAALAPTHYFAGDSITTVSASGNTGDTLALTGARPGVAQRIYSVMVYGAGTVSLVSPTITKADGTTVIAKLGGATTATPFVWTFPDAPINCAPNDNAVLTATLTGATAGSVQVAVNYKLAPAT
jgi:hypothetical protein